MPTQEPADQWHCDFSIHQKRICMLVSFSQKKKKKKNREKKKRKKEEDENNAPCFMCPASYATANHVKNIQHQPKIQHTAYKQNIRKAAVRHIMIVA